MTFRVLVLVLVLAGCASCSYEPGGKTESAVNQSVDKFHARLNQQSYQEIYIESDPELRARITEAQFTAQLFEAHRQLGTVTNKARVMFDDSWWAGIKRAFRGSGKRFGHGNIAESDELFVNEVFVWALSDDEPRLVSFQLGNNVCMKPCRLGFGYGPP